VTHCFAIAQAYTKYRVGGVVLCFYSGSYLILYFIVNLPLLNCSRFTSTKASRQFLLLNSACFNEKKPVKRAFLDQLINQTSIDNTRLIRRGCRHQIPHRRPLWKRPFSRVLLKKKVTRTVRKKEMSRPFHQKRRHRHCFLYCPLIAYYLQ
jgi:hypothetical protein